MLHENQLKLIRHLARFQLLDYTSCLHILDTAGTGDKTALSYVFRPLTKHKYLTKRKDGTVAILAKGRALFPELKPLISVGGGSKETRRIMEVSRMAMLMEDAGVPCVGTLPNDPRPHFIPSACWRKIAPGILSTTRFVGMLLAYGERLAVYDIGDGRMEWQVRAEGSLFYTKYGSYETCATGMIFVCQSHVRNKVAKRIIQQTMWHRRQLLSTHFTERDKPVRWSRSPIKLKAQYEHVYLATPETLSINLRRILSEKQTIEKQRGDAAELNDPAQGDYEIWPYRYFANPATDLLKFVYFFSAIRELMSILENPDLAKPILRYAVCIRPEDTEILDMYPEIWKLEGLKSYEYQPKRNNQKD